MDEVRTDDSARRFRSLRRWGLAMLFVTGWVIADAPPSFAQDPGTKIKAAYLYNFTKFLEWPDAAHSGPDSPIRICLLGQTDVEGVLGKAVIGKSVRGRSIAVEELGAETEPDRLSPCHVVFVTRAASSRTAGLVEHLSSEPVALVGEEDGFVAGGGTLGLVEVSGKIKVQLSMSAANSAGLKISGKLQQVAIAID